MRNLEFIDSETIFLPWKYSEGEKIIPMEFQDKPNECPLIFNQEYFDKFLFGNERFKELYNEKLLYVSHICINNQNTMNGASEYDENDVMNPLAYTIYPSHSVCRVIEINIDGCIATTKDCPVKIFDTIKELSYEYDRIYIKNSFLYDPNEENMWESLIWSKFFLCIDENNKGDNNAK